MKDAFFQQSFFTQSLYRTYKIFMYIASKHKICTIKTYKYMRYPKLILLIVAFFLAGNLCADNDAKKTKASLEQATVFFNGAELTHKASATVTRGVNEVWISELSPSIDINSLKIKASKGAIIASFEYSHDFINKKEVSKLEKSLKDSVKYYKRLISEYEISQQTNEDLLDLLKENKSIGGTQTGLSVAELSKMVDYYKLQSNTLNRAQHELEEKQEKAEEDLRRVEAQLYQESAKNTKSVGVLKLNLTSPLATNVEFTITYFTRSANWIPYYDINVPSMEEKIQIASKAKVAQTTGLDWNKVKLALSTAAPSTNKEAPLFSAWFLDFQGNFARDRSPVLKRSAPLAQNTVSYDEILEERAPEITIRGASSLQSAEPLYIINGQPATAEEFANLSPDMIQDMEVLKDASATTLYGSRASNGVVLITTKSLNDFIDRSEGELSTVYNIDLPYTIQGNGKVQNIDLQSNVVPAIFKHYAIPKLDSEVFIIAEIADWQKLGLLSGKANVTFDGTYVGETVINATSIAPKLTLTLGTDKRVTVKREKIQDYSSKKTLGKDIQQDFTYKITVRNNHNRDITMVLKDQYPISKQKDIKVEILEDTTPATYTNEGVGVNNWEFDLKTGESKEIKMSYRVKYPKDKVINLY